MQRAHPLAFPLKICYSKYNVAERDREWRIGAEVPWNSLLFLSDSREALTALGDYKLSEEVFYGKVRDGTGSGDDQLPLHFI